MHLLEFLDSMWVLINEQDAGSMTISLIIDSMSVRLESFKCYTLNRGSTRISKALLGTQLQISSSSDLAILSPKPSSCRWACMS